MPGCGVDGRCRRARTGPGGACPDARRGARARVHGRARAPSGLVGADGLIFSGLLGGLAFASLAWWAATRHPVSAPAVGAAAAVRWGLVLTMVASQLPLTLANSVVATRAAAEHYFGAKGSARVTPANLLASIAATSVLAAALGTLPTCHGSGGLTAHVKGGARRAFSTAAFGGLLVVLGVVAWGAALPIGLPRAAVAVLLALTGVHHVALTKTSLSRCQTAWPVLASGVVTVAADSLLAGVVAAIAALHVARIHSSASATSSVRPNNEK